MSDEIVNMLPQASSFGSMSQEQILVSAQNPPKPDAERAAKGLGPDPLSGVLMGSTSRINQVPTTSYKLQKGSRHYHTKKKIEVTMIKHHEDTGKATVQKDDGTRFMANMSNLRYIG